MKREDWIWMPHPGHLIVSRDCRFHLNTCVGDFIVSTVGEYLPDAPVREILAQRRGVSLLGRGDARLADYMKKMGFQEIGAGRLYETMVFKATNAPGGPHEECCLYRQLDGREVAFHGYNNPRDAYEGHMAMCEEWSRKTLADIPSEDD